MRSFPKTCTFFPIAVKKEKLLDFFPALLYHIDIVCVKIPKNGYSIGIFRERRGLVVNVRYDIGKLKKIIDDICALTGLCMAILDTKQNYLYSNGREKSRFCAKVHGSAEGRARCSCSDREMISEAESTLRPVSHICHAGLRDTVVPILRDGIVAGFIIIGRVRPSSSPVLRENYSGLNMTEAEYRELYMELEYLSDEKFAGLIDLLSHILFENAIDVDYDKVVSSATSYIDRNLHRQITVEELCRELYISKNLLYKKFRQCFDTTLNEYITAKRIDRAKILLDTAPDASRKIAELCGFENYTYFSKLFKRKTGMSPREYRNTNKKTIDRADFIC